jgi:TnpA family transposase
MRSIKLPELLIEVDNALHFTKSFLPFAKQEKREAEDVFGVLVSVLALGCFMGPYTMARSTPGIAYEQIRRIIDWQITEDAEGKTSSSDGQRFEFRRKSLQKTYSVRFGDFALEFYTFVADNFAPYFSCPKEATDRDASYVLDGILYNESELNIEEHYTDTHGYTEINFAAFSMLGRKFNPRIRGIQRQRIYRIDKNKDYGSLSPLVSSNKRLIRMDWIVENWDEMGRFYASLERGHATASTALKRLAGLSEQNSFYCANREYGRVLKTENILESMSDPVLRKNRRRGLLKGEQIHQLARDIAYAKRGKVPARDLQEQQNTCSCLTLIMAAIVYWQANEMRRVIDEHGQDLDEASLSMLTHISPISWDNVLLYGEYVVDKSLIK